MIVETGQAAANADSYASLADASAYHSARGNSAWAAAASDTAREQALVRATDHMERELGRRWSGERQTDAQRLSWPRDHASYRDDRAVASSSVPREVVEACCEVALVALASDLAPSVGPGEGGSLSQDVVTVGPITLSQSFATPREAGPSAPSLPKAWRRLSSSGLVGSAGMSERG